MRKIDRVDRMNVNEPRTLNRLLVKSSNRLLLNDQIALVTGASSGIGKAVAIALAQAGAHVAVNYFEAEKPANDVVKTIKRLGRRAMPVSADVSREDEVQGMFRRVIEEFGAIDILVNNAGVQVDAPIDEMTVQQWSRVIDTNLTGQFLCCREAIKEFKRRGVVNNVSSSAGKIIFISSVHEIIPWAGHANYAASKGGVHAADEEYCSGGRRVQDSG
jgi:glucose 1-dehydrogenase